MIIEPILRKLKRLIRHNKFSFAIGAAIFAACILTTLSLVLYNLTGTAKLDLSRPGYDQARKQLKTNDKKTQDDFKANGVLTNEAMKNYLKNYRKQAVDLKSYDDFSKKLLDDSSLGLTAEQILPSDGANPSE